MKKPKNFATGDARPCIHLRATIGSGFNELITKPGSQFGRSIRAATIDNNDLRARRTRAQMLKKRTDERSLIQHRHDDRELRSHTFSEFAWQVAVLQRHPVCNGQIHGAYGKRRSSASCSGFHLKILSKSNFARL